MFCTVILLKEKKQVLQGSKDSNSPADIDKAYDSFTSSDEVVDDLPF
jgi:hypothetical protein